MIVASNIFNSPPNTGPGNFGRRLAQALLNYGVQLLPDYMCGTSAEVYLGNAFFDRPTLGLPKVLRVDGLGAGHDFQRVADAHRRADIVVYQSEYSARKLQNTHQYEPTNAYVIHNGVEIPTKYKRVYNGEANFISICNTWNKARYEKFFDIVYKSMYAILKTMPTFHWTIVGKYKEFKAVMDSYSFKPDKLPITFVDFTPTLGEMRAWAKGCIHIVPTDSCPNSVIESMAVGLPCIVIEDSAGPELIGNGGIVISGEGHIINKTNEIVEAINTIARNEDYYSKQARAFAEEKLDINKVAKMYAEVFNVAQNHHRH